jgi:hypothetical protein
MKMGRAKAKAKGLSKTGPRGDKSWLAENMETLMTLASESERTKGRGAIIVDDTAPGQAPSIFYLPEAEISMDDPEARRLVRDYSPSKEIVVMLVHPDAERPRFSFVVPRSTKSK